MNSRINAATRLCGGDLIVEYLVREKVPYVFGVCGHGNIGFLDSALKAQDRIKTVMTHHEQTAGFMAEAYYKVSHRPVATYTSCGPGSCNLPVALASAMMDSAAYLAITGNVPTSQFNRNAFQESGKFFQADFPSVIRPYVKRSFQPTRVEMLPLALKQAFGLMRTGRPGPVNLDVPLNVFVEQGEMEVPEPDPRVAQRTPGDPAAVRRAWEMLAGAERPVVIAGQGVLLAEASEELRAFAELTGIPVATSPNGKGSIDETHELALGPIGRNGTYAANGASSKADVILALGFSFDDRASSAWLPGYTFSIPPSRLIQVDLDPAEIGRNYPVELGILADIRGFLAGLVEVARAGSPRRPTDAWLSELGERRKVWERYHAPLGASTATPVRPERLIRALGNALPPEAIVAADVGSHHNWLVQLWTTRRPRRFLQSWGFGSMGFATSGILGAKLAAPEAPCIAVVGDGSFLMTPHAVATAVEYGIPVVWVVWNNFGFTSIRDLQLGAFKRELDSSFRRADTGELYSPDFASLARSFGADGVRVDRPGDLEETLAAAVRAGRPSLVEVMIDREIRPVATGGWELPPLPPAQPNFEKLALGR
ncbi:MAG TPA: thiamine pyrophosphate-binding protein [Burkholderiales bacterium]|nr:thiamine pyrophosphate-binding protein [Burkholderiales bacterium]